MTADRALRLVAGALALAGAALRLAGLGSHGFWNDEAWVATISRVDGTGQFLLALSVTPIGWGALLRPLAALPAPPELALRLLPALCGLATLWFAWRLGGRLAGHALGGLLALALVAFDPSGIAWAQQLKPYTAEAALSLATFLAAVPVARHGRTADVVRLALLLAFGVALSHAQLLLAPPLLLALAARALLRRDRAALRRLVVAGVLVGLWDLTWFTLAVHPWLTPALGDYWRARYPPPSGMAALGPFARGAFAHVLAPALGPSGIGLALSGLVVLLWWRDCRWAAGAILLLVVELVGVSWAGTFPLSEPRTMLFLSTLLLVTTGAGAGRLAIALWPRRPLRPVVVAAAALAAAVVVTGHWGPRALRVVPEDLGPLLQRMERERRAGDRILLYGRSLFIWGFYRTGTPRLIPVPELANGWTVVVDDPELTLVGGRDADAMVTRAFDGAARVWFVGSRLRPSDERGIQRALLRRGRVVEEERRELAVLQLLEPR